VMGRCYLDGDYGMRECVFEAEGFGWLVVGGLIDGCEGVGGSLSPLQWSIERD
jgi:hypothetical protein